MRISIKDLGIPNAKPKSIQPLWVYTLPEKSIPLALICSGSFRNIPIPIGLSRMISIPRTPQDTLSYVSPLVDWLSMRLG